MITFVTCWYRLKAKFPKEIYKTWINNLLSNVKNFNLVIFTDTDSIQDIEEFLKNNPQIVVVQKPMKEFHCYKYKAQWKENHNNNTQLNGSSRWGVDWELNMLWSEKIHFVREVIDNKYFNSKWYGWCDIGYFRGRLQQDLPVNQIQNWPKVGKEDELKEEKIYYNVVGTNEQMRCAMQCVMNSNEKTLPSPQFPPQQVTISGGFFVIHQENIGWWWTTYYSRLELYFNNNYLVKDDQIIVTDCLLRDMNRFCLIKGQIGDPWFAFSHYLL